MLNVESQKAMGPQTRNHACSAEATAVTSWTGERKAALSQVLASAHISSNNEGADQKQPMLFKRLQGHATMISTLAFHVLPWLLVTKA